MNLKKNILEIVAAGVVTIGLTTCGAAELTNGDYACTSAEDKNGRTGRFDLIIKTGTWDHNSELGLITKQKSYSNFVTKDEGKNSYSLTLDTEIFGTRPKFIISINKDLTLSGKTGKSNTSTFKDGTRSYRIRRNSSFTCTIKK